jgi:hypothetical protein
MTLNQTPNQTFTETFARQLTLRCQLVSLPIISSAAMGIASELNNMHNPRALATHLVQQRAHLKVSSGG